MKGIDRRVKEVDRRLNGVVLKEVDRQLKEVDLNKVKRIEIDQVKSDDQEAMMMTMLRNVRNGSVERHRRLAP
jgi:hypothetical protein